MNKNEIESYLDLVYRHSGIKQIVENYINDLVVYGHVDKFKYENEIENCLNNYFKEKK